jgi:hypothetical protein
MVVDGYLINFADRVVSVEELLQILQRVQTFVALYVCLAVHLPPQQRAGRCPITCISMS